MNINNVNINHCMIQRYMCRTGNQMATAGADKVVKLWDPTTGAHKASLRVSLPPSPLLFSVVTCFTFCCSVVFDALGFWYATADLYLFLDSTRGVPNVLIKAATV